jgi:hypothetical protein
MKYRGSCHCGRLAFEFEGEIASVVSCNCSICSKKGSLLTFMPREALHVLAAEGDIGTYTFNKHHIQHRFCPRCGIHPWGEGRAPDGTPMAAVNVRCIEDFDLSAVTVQTFDGRSL